MLRFSSIFAFSLLLIAPLTTNAYSNEAMLCLVNKERKANGLPAMGLDPLLTKAAQLHSDDQARMKRMSHDGSDGSNASTRLTRVGFQWRSMAENVAYGYPDSVSCMKAWMESPGHRANILGNCEMFGSAVAYSGPTPYYTQNFGTDSKGRRNVPKCDGSESGGGGGNYQQPTQPSYGGGGGGKKPGNNQQNNNYQNNYNNNRQNNNHQNNYNNHQNNNNYNPGNWIDFNKFFGGRNPWQQQPTYGGGNRPINQGGMFYRPAMRYGGGW